MMGSGGCENDPSDSGYTAGLLETLPEVEKVIKTSIRFNIHCFVVQSVKEAHRVLLADSLSLLTCTLLDHFILSKLL